jgi:integrase
MLTIPAALTKNKRQHSIPLPTLSMKLLDACPFSSNSWSKNKRRLDQLSGVSNWKLHDLRRSFSTIHAQIGTQPHIIEALLNHASGQISGVASIYNRYRYFDEMTQAMRAYETHLKRVLHIP